MADFDFLCLSCFSNSEVISDIDVQLTLIIFLLSNSTLSLYILIISILIYIPGMAYLKKWELVTSACSETESLFYSRLGLVNLITNSTNITPGNMYEILINKKDVKLI